MTRGPTPGGPTPPRWATALIRMTVPGGLVRDSVLGDLEEDYTHSLAAAGPGGARRRYVRQALAVAARYGAHRALAAIPTRREDGGGTMSFTVIHATQQAFRSLMRAPGFALLAVLTLGAGVGATTAIFTVVDAVLVRPLPYPHASELVVFRYGQDGDEMDNHSEPEYLDYRNDLSSFSAVGAYAETSLGIGSGEEPQRVAGARATPSLFRVLGVDPHLGRVFTAAEGEPGGENVVVLSHALWTEAFGADAGILGTTVLLGDRTHQVVGVMPRGFAFPFAGTQAWVPLVIDPINPWARNNHYLSVVGRLAPGVGLDAARSELAAFSNRTTRAWPDIYSTPASFVAYSMRERVVGDVRPALLLLFGAVVGVLLIASVNAAALFLARGEGRRGEIAVRAAMGAGRGRIAAQLMAESLMVALLAAAAGVAMAYGGVEVLRTLAPPTLPRLDEVVVNGRVLGFGVIVAALTGLFFGLAPALQALGGDVREVLASGGRGGVGGRTASRFRRGLVVVQLAAATTLALSAVLLVRSFQAMNDVDLGMDPRGVVIVPLYPSESSVPENGPAVEFYRGLEVRAAALPGVTRVGAALRLPLAGGHDGYSIQVEGRLVDNIGDSPTAGMQYITPGYFEAMGIPLRRGRHLTEADGADGALVAVVNERMARELWPGGDPLGKRLRMFPEGNPWMEVVGVVADVKHYGIREAPSAKLYIPHAQGERSAYYAPNRMHLVVRTEGDPATLVPSLRALVREVGSGIPLGSVRTMEEVVSAAMSRERFTLLLLGTFAGVALLLAAVGVYGVTARAVAARTREIGVRMAVGAGRGAIAGAVLREGLVLAGLGCALGLTGGLLLARLLRALLFGVSPADPWSSAAAAVLMGATVLAACVVPAVAASRLDPVRALRSD